jgi:hypothetical protein
MGASFIRTAGSNLTAYLRFSSIGKPADGAGPSADSRSSAQQGIKSRREIHALQMREIIALQGNSPFMQW